MPAPYVNFLGAFSFMTLDMVQFVPFECMYTKSSFDHLDALFFESLVPLALLVAAQLIASAQTLRKYKQGNKQANKPTRESASQRVTKPTRHQSCENVQSF